MVNVVIDGASRMVKLINNVQGIKVTANRIYYEYATGRFWLIYYDKKANYIADIDKLHGKRYGIISRYQVQVIT